MTWLRSHQTGLLGFAVAAAYWPTLPDAAFVPRWALIAVALACVSTLDPRNLPVLLRYVLGFLVVIAALSLIGSPDARSGTLDLFYIVILCGVMLLGAELDSLDDVMVGMAFGLMPSVALSAWQYFGGWSPVPVRGPAGFLFNSEVLAELCALVAVWCCVSRRLWLAGILAVPIVLCQSRIGAIAAAAAVLYGLRPPARWLFPASVILLMLGIASVVSLGPEKFTFAVHRAMIWGAMAATFVPLGNGLGWFAAVHPLEQYGHSDVLQAFAELGIAALALATIPFLALTGNRGTNAERALFVAVCIEAMVSFPLHLPASGFVAAIVAGYLVSVRPVVRLEQRGRRIADGTGLQRAFAAGRGFVEASGFFRQAVAVRPVLAPYAPTGSRRDRAYSAAAGIGDF
jgi:hypothetical protein